MKAEDGGEEARGTGGNEVLLLSSTCACVCVRSANRECPVFITGFSDSASQPPACQLTQTYS